MPVIIVFILVALVIAGPLIVIWALNQLFGFSIDYTFWNWLAVIVLTGVLKAERNDK
jgi:hypothetical protein